MTKRNRILNILPILCPDMTNDEENTRRQIETILNALNLPHEEMLINEILANKQDLLNKIVEVYTTCIPNEILEALETFFESKEGKEFPAIAIQASKIIAQISMEWGKQLGVKLMTDQTFQERKDQYRA